MGYRWSLLKICVKMVVLTCGHLCENFMNVLHAIAGKKQAETVVSKKQTLQVLGALPTSCEIFCV